MSQKEITVFLYNGEPFGVVSKEEGIKLREILEEYELNYSRRNNCFGGNINPLAIDYYSNRVWEKSIGVLLNTFILNINLLECKELKKFLNKFNCIEVENVIEKIKKLFSNSYFRENDLTNFKEKTLCIIKKDMIRYVEKILLNKNESLGFESSKTKRKIENEIKNLNLKMLLEDDELVNFITSYIIELYFEWVINVNSYLSNHPKQDWIRRVDLLSLFDKSRDSNSTFNRGFHVETKHMTYDED